jgi:formate dehydrogenase subunit gamma
MPNFTPRSLSWFPNPTRWAMFAVAIGLMVVLVLPFLGGATAWAQSSVRPPEATGGAVPGGALGTTNDSELWRQIRKGAQGMVSIPDKQAGILVQSSGEKLLAIRRGPVTEYVAWALLGVVVVLALFFLARGRIKIDAGFSGRTVLRFDTLERVAHWMTAGSFIVLGLTGLNLLYGKALLLPLIGKPAFAQLTILGKYAHNYLGFAFTAGVILMVLLWVKDNLPNRHDLKWIAMGGGLFVKGMHPPAKKFNAGQKLIFWSVVLLGASIATTGFSLMFPFEFAPFAGTFEILNKFGLSLPTELTMLEETQLALLWHSIVAAVLIVIIIAHIYIGSLGMEGAIDAVTTGEVDENWAREHHGLWLEEQRKARK